MRSLRLIAGLLIGVLAAFGALAQEPAIPLYETLGSFSRTITTSSEKAQRYFNQGMILAYAFGREEAVTSFREAQQSDPDCAMCYWGEAWALGPYQNGKMTVPHGVEALAAMQNALELLDKTSSVEKALIEAMAVRYKEEPLEDERAALDEAYVEAMRSVVAGFPGDLDAAALLGESLMILHPWDLWTLDGEPREEALDAIAVLETVLEKTLEHPGACHLYIHAIEPSPDPGRAELCADALTRIVPGASHLQHMPSHIYMRIGRYEDAVRANQQAHLVDLQAAEGRAVAIYPSHNVNMLTFAAWMDGQSALALQSARDAGRTSPDSAGLALMMARFGRWEEILELKSHASEDVDKGFRKFAVGLAQLRVGEERKARRSLRELSRLTASVPEDRKMWRRFSPRDFLDVATWILEGEMARAQGRQEDAVALFEAAVEVEDRFPYSEPELWPLPARQFLGAVLLEAGRSEEAENVYLAELADHVENGWSLFGLQLSLEAQGKETEAREVGERFQRAWARADVLLTSSRF